MASPYDALLDPPAAASKYDALLQPAPSPYDALLAEPAPVATPVAPGAPLLTKSEELPYPGFGAGTVQNQPDTSAGGLNLGAIGKHVLSKWIDTLNTATGSEEDANKDQEILKLRQEGSAPVIQLPKPTDNTTGAGIVRGLETSAEGLTTPDNLTIMAALGGAPGVVQKVAAAGFAAMMAKDVPDKISDALADTTPGGKAQKITEAIAQAAMAVLAAKHAAGRSPIAAPERLASMEKVVEKARALNASGDHDAAAEALKSGIQEPPYQDQSNAPATIAAESPEPITQRRMQPDDEANVIESTKGYSTDQIRRLSELTAEEKNNDLRDHAIEIYRNELISRGEDPNIPSEFSRRNSPETITPLTAEAAGQTATEQAKESPAATTTPEPSTSEPASSSLGEDAKAVDAEASAEPAGMSVGPGAASIDEKIGSGSLTSIKNAMVDEQRDKIGLPTREPVVRRAFGGVWDEAMAAFDKNDAVGRELVTGLQGKMRPLTDLEDAILTHEQADRQGRYDQAVDDVNKAESDPERATAQARMAKARDDLHEIYDIGNKAGTANARGLSARRMMIKEDYSLAKMEYRKKAENGGQPLPDGQLAEVKKAHDRIAELEKKISDSEDARKDELSKHYFDQLLKETRKDLKETAKQGKSFTDFTADQAQKARARITARRREGRLNSLPVNELVDHAIIGADYIAKGAKTLAEFSKNMLADFGEAVRPFLSEIFDKSKEFHDANEKVFKTGAKSAETTTAKPAEVLARAASEAKGGEPLSHKTVYDLARAHVNAGVEGFDAVMKATHADIQKIHKDIGEREVRDAFSEYGKVKFPSKEADRMKLAEYRRIGQLVSAIEDANAGKAPSKTGLQRSKPTMDVREKMAELKTAMDRAGIETKSAEDQLASRNQARATALKNSIEALDKRLKTGEKPVAGARVTDSPEVERLRSERDSMRAQLKEIEDAAKPKKSAEDSAHEDAQQGVDAAAAALDKWDRILKGEIEPPKASQREAKSQLEADMLSEVEAMKKAAADIRRDALPKADPAAGSEKAQLAALDKSIADYERRLRESDFSTKGKSNGPDSAAVTKAKALRDAAKKAFDDLKAAQKPKRSPDQIKLDNYKKSLQRQIDTLQDRTSKGDYAPRPKVKTVLDEAAIKLKTARDLERQKFEEGLIKDRLANRTTAAKMADAAVSWSRIAKLSSVKVFPKLLEAAVFRAVFEPISRVVGQPLRFIAPDVYRKAYPESGASVKAAAKYISTGLTSWGKAWEKLRTGRTNIDVAAGKIAKDPEMLNFVGNAHGMMKEPLRQASFEASKQLRLEQAIKHGLDPNDPVTQTGIISGAAEDANRQVFMGPNAITKYIAKIGIGAAKNSKSGEVRALGRVMEFLMPIMNVSSNITVHALRLNPLVGFPEFAARMAAAYNKGELSNGAAKLSEADAQLLSRVFKTATLGTILSAYAWTHPQYFGGTHEEGPRKPGQMKPDELKLFGVTLPGWMNHAPEISHLNTVASARRVYDRYVKRDPDEKVNAALETAGFTLMSPVKHFPFIDTYARLFSESKSPGRTLAALVRDAVIPSAVPSVLYMTDKEERRPKTVADEIKMSIPGLRETVKTKEQAARDSHHRR